MNLKVKPPNSLSRRDFVKKSAATAVGLSTVGLLNFIYNSENETDTGTISERRKQAAYRKRRIIINNDGNDFNSNNTTPEEPKTPENFLSKRTAPLVNSQVDAIFYCTGTFNYYTHRSKETELKQTKKAASRYVHKLIDYDTDSLEVITKFCHEHDMECFWSMRMNDNHDSIRDSSLSQWKRNHPELLIGRKGDQFPYISHKWSMVDYGKEQVRDKVYRILEDVTVRYDIDGLEYDFFRHPGFFRPQFMGEPVTDEHRGMMTDLLRRVREMADNIGERRGKPILIACRLPDSIEFCRAIGLDLERWLEEDLVDIITGCGYFKLEPWENLVSLGERFNVPVYACLVKRRIIDGKTLDNKTVRKIWRGEALNAWKAGMDGIYIFNQFNPNARIFREVGALQELRSKESIDQTVYVSADKDASYLQPEYWLKDGRSYVSKEIKPL